MAADIQWNNRSYVPSGRVNWGIFLPLLAATFVVSAVMAFLMAWSERYFLIKVVTAVLFGLPVLILSFVTIYYGQCRNPKLAGGATLVAVTFYYLWYWLLSYYFIVLANGPAMVTVVKEISGADGLLGYVFFRAKIMPGQFGLHTFAGMVVNIGLYGLEFGLLLATAAYMARRMSRRAFYEEYGKWATSVVFLFQPSELATVLDAVEAQDWARLDSIGKAASDIYRRRHGIGFRTEYLPGSFDQPAYITISGPILLRRFRPLVAVLPVLGRLTKRWISQREVPADSLKMLAAHVGGIDIATTDTQPTAPAKDGVIGYWAGQPPIHGGESAPGAIQSMFRETGFGAATLVGKGADFRDAASQRSFALLITRPDAGLAAIEGIDASLCYRADANPVPTLRRLSWLDLSFTLVFMLGSFAWLPMMILSNVVRMNVGQRAGDAVVIAAVGIVGLGLLAFLFHSLLMTNVLHLLLLRKLSTRTGALVTRPVRLPSDVVRIEDPKTFHVSKLTGEDWGLCLYDATNARLIIDGISHRYVIRAKDARWLRLTATTNSMSILLGYRIGEEDFEVVLNRYARCGTLLGGFAGQPIIGVLFKPVITARTKRFAAKIGRVLHVQLSA